MIKPWSTPYDRETNLELLARLQELQVPIVTSTFFGRYLTPCLTRNTDYQNPHPDQFTVVSRESKLFAIVCPYTENTIKAIKQEIRRHGKSQRYIDEFFYKIHKQSISTTLFRRQKRNIFDEMHNKPTDFPQAYCKVTKIFHPSWIITPTNIGANTLELVLNSQ
jgi:hypothetical protein